MEKNKQAAIVFEKGIARVTYNYDFAEVRRVDESGEESVDVTFKSVQYYGVPSSNGIKKAVLEAEFPTSVEQKLINEYNIERLHADALSASAGKAHLAASASVSKYKAFLERRAALFALIEKDCEEAGIQ